ncbi:hypothetical protein DFQ27_001720 [Actinomortierella ambigua]|uniref:25S rRNA adenine-N(1) methyltransferase n=1 Tax=Actinomortierella ambigua TaxID=1343610 RepID=A0A9P6UD01_9FUNG|nr:hypothetical protein DFQ27_001720 [Actinomortierella ambigua]
MGRVKPKRKAPVTATTPGIIKSGPGSNRNPKELVQKLASAIASQPSKQAGKGSAALSILSTLAQDGNGSGAGTSATAAETTSVTSSLLMVKGSSMASRKKTSLATAQLIRQYHTLNKELSKCLARVDKRMAQSSEEKGRTGRGGQRGDQKMHEQQPLNLTGKIAEEHEADLARIIEIRQQMDDLGGLDMYQKASTLGQSKQRGGDSSRWLVPVLQRIYFPEPTKTTSTASSSSTTSSPPSKNKLDPPLRLLDVGALSPFNYEKQSNWIKVTPIDLNPQHPQIQKMDFLEMPVPTQDQDRYDVVCLSLVVNFVGDPAQRGEILRQATRCLVPRRGILYLVLPLPCIDNSRYMDHELLVAMMRHLGCSTLLDHHFAKKLAYYAFRFDGESPPLPPSSSSSSSSSGQGSTTHSLRKSTTGPVPRFPKKLRRDKPNCNNFCIILQ